MRAVLYPRRHRKTTRISPSKTTRRIHRPLPPCPRSLHYGLRRQAPLSPPRPPAARKPLRGPSCTHRRYRPRRTARQQHRQSNRGPAINPETWPRQAIPAAAKVPVCHCRRHDDSIGPEQPRFAFAVRLRLPICCCRAHRRFFACRDFEFGPANYYFNRLCQRRHGGSRRSSRRHGPALALRTALRQGMSERFFLRQ